MFGKNKSTGSIEYIVVGLGNPDRKYENTRHNAGWLAIDRIADKLGCDVNKIKYKKLYRHLHCKRRKSYADETHNIYEQQRSGSC